MSCLAREPAAISCKKGDNSVTEQLIFDSHPSASLVRSHTLNLVGPKHAVQRRREAHAGPGFLQHEWNTRRSRISTFWFPLRLPPSMQPWHASCYTVVPPDPSPQVYSCSNAIPSVNNIQQTLLIVHPLKSYFSFAALRKTLVGCC